MKFGFKEFKINSPFKTTTCGHLSQTFLVDTYHDDLYCREFILEDGDKKIIHLSLDLLSFSLEARNELDCFLKEYYGDKNVHLITSATHTHYGNNVLDKKYQEYLLELLKKEIVDIKIKEYANIDVSYKCINFNEVGKSRISGYETNNEYLALLKLKADDVLLNIIIHNVHPTILNANVPYFSAEFPGYVLNELKKAYPNEAFTYMSGAMGDISSRFTRSRQDYESLMILGDKLFNKIKELKNSDSQYLPLVIDYNEEKIIYNHDFKPVDTSKIRDGLTDREMETIHYGQIMRSRLNQDDVAKYALFVVLKLGDYKLVFYPNEIFSEYLNYIDINNTMLVSYSNGYGPYILPIDFAYITYEMFTDTLDNDTKKRIIDSLKRV